MRFPQRHLIEATSSTMPMTDHLVLHLPAERVHPSARALAEDLERHLGVLRQAIALGEVPTAQTMDDLVRLDTRTLSYLGATATQDSDELRALWQEIERLADLHFVGTEAAGSVRISVALLPTDEEAAADQLLRALTRLSERLEAAVTAPSPENTHEGMEGLAWLAQREARSRIRLHEEEDATATLDLGRLAVHPAHNVYAARAGLAEEMGEWLTRAWNEGGVDRRWLESLGARRMEYLGAGDEAAVFALSSTRVMKFHNYPIRRAEDYPDFALAPLEQEEIRSERGEELFVSTVERCSPLGALPTHLRTLQWKALEAGWYLGDAKCDNVGLRANGEAAWIDYGGIERHWSIDLENARKNAAEARRLSTFAAPSLDTLRPVKARTLRR